MSITDELREYASHYSVAESTKDKLLTAIADRIDAEHQKAIRELNNLADASVLLPVDADGERIRIGDVMEWVRYGDDDPTIVRTVIGVGFEVFFAWSDEQGRYAQYEANAYRHHHAPTVEDVLREMVAAYMDTSLDDSNDGEFFAQYAAKLQLMESDAE